MYHTNRGTSPFPCPIPELVGCLPLWSHLRPGHCSPSSKVDGCLSLWSHAGPGHCSPSSKVDGCLPLWSHAGQGIVFPPVKWMDALWSHAGPGHCIPSSKVDDGCLPLWSHAGPGHCSPSSKVEVDGPGHACHSGHMQDQGIVVPPVKDGCLDGCLPATLVTCRTRALYSHQ